MIGKLYVSRDVYFDQAAVGNLFHSLPKTGQIGFESPSLTVF